MALREQIAPTGVLRVALNMSNFLLVSGQQDDGTPTGVSPDIAHALAAELGVDCELIQYEGPGQVADDAGNNAWDICLLYTSDAADE